MDPPQIHPCFGHWDFWEVGTAAGMGKHLPSGLVIPEHEEPVPEKHRIAKEGRQRDGFGDGDGRGLGTGTRVTLQGQHRWEQAWGCVRV